MLNLSIFCAPKSFIDEHSRIIQRNAIKSWLSLKPLPEIILLGNENGIADVAKEFNIRHIPNVECNEYGMPFISSIFSIGQAAAKFPVVCYLNCDIILLDDFLLAIQRVIQELPGEDFLIIGRRWDLDIKTEIDFFDTHKEHIKANIKKAGKLQPPDTLDYFVFRKGRLNNILPFIVGRPIWDNWMVYHAWRKSAKVIDITSQVMVIHPIHGLGWKKTFKISKHLDNDQYMLRLINEVNYNIKLRGDSFYMFTTKDAVYRLSAEGLRPNKLAMFYLLLIKLYSEYKFFKIFKPLIKIAKWIKDGEFNLEKLKRIG